MRRWFVGGSLEGYECRLRWLERLASGAVAAVEFEIERKTDGPELVLSSQSDLRLLEIRRLLEVVLEVSSCPGIEFERNKSLWTKLKIFEEFGTVLQLVES